MLKKIMILMFFILFSAQAALANIDNLLNNIVAGTYVQKPGIYKSPAGTTMSLGSASFRLKSDLLGRPLFSVQPPRATLSCAGADFDAGMISMLGLNQFEGMFSQAGSSLAWGLAVGLVYSTPGLKDAFNTLQEWSRWSQSLFQHSCDIGIALGKDIGKSIWGRQTTEAAEAETASQGTLYSQAMKSIADAVKVKDVVQTFPWGSLSKAGVNDPDIMDLIANWFGWLDVYLVDDNGNRVEPTSTSDVTANKCGGSSCSDSNIKSFPMPHKADITIDNIIYGGNWNHWSCSLQESLYCQGGPYWTTQSITGLKPAIENELKALRDTLTSAGGTTQDYLLGINGVDSSNSSVFAYVSVLPNLLDVMNYAARLQSYTDSRYQSMSDTIISNTAEYISYLLLQQFGQQAYEYLAESIGGDSVVASHIPEEQLREYMQNVRSAMAALSNKLRERNDVHQMYVNAYQEYRGFRDYSNQSIKKIFGSGATGIFK